MQTVQYRERRTSLPFTMNKAGPPLFSTVTLLRIIFLTLQLALYLALFAPAQWAQNVALLTPLGLPGNQVSRQQTCATGTER